MYHIASLNIGFDYFMVIIEKTLTKYFAIFTQQSKWPIQGNGMAAISKGVRQAIEHLYVPFFKTRTKVNNELRTSKF